MIIITSTLFRQLFPHAPAAIVQAFVDHQADMAEVCMTPERLAMAFANCYAETSGFYLPGLTENIMYTAKRMAEVWPTRFGDAVQKGNKVVHVPNPSKVVAKYGSAAGWQNKAFDDIYGGRMGNRPGTRDGSRYIGRGGPQLTGRDEYNAIGLAIGVDLLSNPEAATRPDLQPAILGAYWKQKHLSVLADQSNVVRVREIWNGGHNGLDVVQEEFPRMLKIIKASAMNSAAPNVQPQKARVDEALRDVQTTLIDMGYFSLGKADGLIGGQTLGAIKNFLIDRGRSDVAAEWPSDELMVELNSAVQQDWRKPVSVARGTASETDVAEKVDSVKHLQATGLWAKLGAWFTGVTGAGNVAFKMLPDAQTTYGPYIDMVKSAFADIPPWVYLAGLFIVCYIVVRGTNAAKRSAVEDYQRGRIS